MLSLSPPSPAAFDQAIDRIAAREAENFKTLQQYSPMVETYIQELKTDKELGLVPEGDHYFLGRATYKGYVRDVNFLGEPFTSRLLHPSVDYPGSRSDFIPLGFAQMAVIDATGFDRQHYDFKFLRREFLGEVRCLLFDVSPKREERAGTLYGTHLGRGPGLQHRSRQRNLHSGQRKGPLPALRYLALEPATRHLATCLYL